MNIRLFAVFLLPLLLFAGCRSKTAETGETALIAAPEAAEQLGLSYKNEGNGVFSMTGKNEWIKGETGDRYIYLNNVKLWLAHPISVLGKTPFLSQYDCSETLKPLLTEKTSVPVPAARTIVIDPGHGGRQAGAVGKSSQEKALNLKIAGQAGKLLEQRGMKVIFTRTGDETLELAPRAKLPAAVKADLFVSVHCNAASDPKSSGIETFSLTPPGSADSNSPERPSAAGQTPASGNRHVTESFLLSAAIQRKLIAATGAVDRGAKRSGFYVLRNNTVPAVLVECGFISNPTEEKKLASPAYQALLAKAIADGITEYVESSGPAAGK